MAAILVICFYEKFHNSRPRERVIYQLSENSFCFQSNSLICDKKDYGSKMQENADIIAVEQLTSQRGMKVCPNSFFVQPLVSRFFFGGFGNYAEFFPPPFSIFFQFSNYFVY